MHGWIYAQLASDAPEGPGQSIVRFHARRMGAKHNVTVIKIIDELESRNRTRLAHNENDYGGKARFQGGCFDDMCCTLPFAGGVFLVTVQHYSPKMRMYRRQDRYVSQQESKGKLPPIGSICTQKQQICVHIAACTDLAGMRQLLGSEILGSNAARSLCDHENSVAQTRQFLLTCRHGNTCVLWWCHKGLVKVEQRLSTSNVLNNSFAHDGSAN